MVEQDETGRTWLQAELEDDFDEELEQEIDDRRLPEDIRRRLGSRHVRTIDRGLYFRELLRLQGELVKLQDWVVHKGLKVVVLFEGRDSAGKGGAIKRITQRTNPRICRVVALPAPARSCCSTAAGTTVPAWSASWVSPMRHRSRIFSATYRNSSACLSVPASSW
jgi:polyphosphate kinase 2 (PPK2 family)